MRDARRRVNSARLFNKRNRFHEPQAALSQKSDATQTYLPSVQLSKQSKPAAEASGRDIRRSSATAISQPLFPFWFTNALTNDHRTIAI